MKMKFTTADQHTRGGGPAVSRLKQFLLVGCALLPATMGFARQNALNEKVKLDISRASLSQVLAALGSQSSFTFNYVKQDFDKIIVNDFKPDNITLNEALNLLRNKSGIEYSVSDKAILLRKAEKDGGTKSTQAITTRKISGRITTENKEPIPGVSVWVKGTKIRTVTDADGKYEVTVDNDKAVLNFSSVGYEMTEVAVGTSDVLNAVMKISSSGLNEVVVVGYGTAKKGDLSAAVSVISDMKKLKERPVMDVPNMLQGQVPGVTVTSNGGHTSNANNIVIRGVGSKNGENVLYVVDGVPGAPFNPADVESVTVLKDAASAAIYGAFAGSAGVILVTTRQATKGMPSVQYTGFVGAKNAWRTLQSLTAEEEAKVSNLAQTTAGNQPLEGWDPAKNPYGAVTRTDWMSEIFRTGIVQRHNISVNAGTDKFSTLFQARYENEEGTLLNTYNKNISLRLNANYQFNKHVKLRQDIFWNNNDNRDAETASGYTGVITSAIYMPRSATPYYADGTFGGVGPRDGAYNGIYGDVVNPVATLLRNRPYNKRNDLQSVTELTISDIIPGLTYINRFSYRQQNGFWKSFTPKRTEPGKPNNQNQLDYSTDKDYNWIWENTLNYNKLIKRHSIGAMVSMTAQESSHRNFKASAMGFENEADWAQFFTNASIFDRTFPSDEEWKDRNVSYVGRLSYSWADRYFVTGSYRYDVAGRLTEGYRGKGFPGLTAAWKISSEPFFNVKGVDLLKVRASWGRIGNIGSLPYYYGYAKLNPDYTYQIGNGAPRVNSLAIANAFNPTLSWETSQQTDIGIDISLLKQRLNITADYFDKLTYDLIKQQNLGWTNTFGQGAPYINQGKISNKGFEVSVNWHDNIGAVGYNIGGNIATLKNRVTYIDGNPNSASVDNDNAYRDVLRPFSYTVGQPINAYWLVKTAGIFQSDDEAKAYTDKTGKMIQPNAKAGDLKFVDQNGDGVINDADRVYMGSAFPKLTYGFTAGVTWKNFDLTMFFQGVSGVKLFNAFKMTTLSGSEQGYNRWNKILDAWSPENKGSDIPRINANDNNKNFQTNSDWYLENGNYLRLKNLLIGYTFKKMSWNQGLRVYFSGDNLLTFTKYSGMDPEVGGVGLDGGQFPVSRVFSVGANVKF
ncbi:TonB-linked SusC/RagA family outer membrane protein [Chitinophaga polysaccharea]|uniref:TonB-linked SusC/RagA family outer membrane protein n=1 Tax=Chitinophaga polysaccharea TaxID=1293035 RepID=A0A561P146_9BACT|nr:TonB-dependent receptor [Chitinophaga polysaccharea]TWF31815.1 TonB-linked SusC/RagA family outer membrane protein [Chitinophaga polysaccharea]